MDGLVLVESPESLDGLFGHFFNPTWLGADAGPRLARAQCSGESWGYFSPTPFSNSHHSHWIPQNRWWQVTKNGVICETYGIVWFKSMVQTGSSDVKCGQGASFQFCNDLRFALGIRRRVPAPTSGLAVVPKSTNDVGLWEKSVAALDFHHIHQYPTFGYVIYIYMYPTFILGFWIDPLHFKKKDLSWSRYGGC